MTPPRRRYRTDLTDAQWRILAPLIPAPKPGGRPAVHQRRELLNAMLYWLRAGCAWRLLPHDLPPWKTVYHYFRCWRLEGRWPQIVRMLRARERTRQGRRPTPSAAIFDSQSMKTTERGAARPRRRQKVNGCKRHLLVDTLGLLLAVHVTRQTPATGMALPRCCADLIGGTCRGCAMAGRMAATAAASWLGRWRGARSPSKWWRGLMVAGGVAGSRQASSRRSSPRSRWSRDAGSWSGPLPGWVASAG